MPRVVVLMPVRDAARTLAAAVRTVLWQTVRDLALVAVDDGSTDGTPGILARIAERDRRVRLATIPAQGIAPALNEGLALCDAEVVARMDADDLAHPRRLESQLAALRTAPRVAAVGARVRLFPRRIVRPGMLRYVEWVNGLDTPERVARDLWVESPLVHPASAIRRGVLEQLGGWRDGDFPEDYDLWLRTTRAGWTLTNVPEELLLWRESPDRATRRDARYALLRHVELKCAHLRETVLAGRTEVALWGAGETGKRFADALRALGVAVAVFIDVDRRKIGRTVRGAPVVGPEGVARARGLPLLVAVGAPGARPLIRAELARQGLCELRDFWCVS